MIELITDPALITPQWFTEVLRECGALPHGEVTAVTWKMIGTGKMGDNARFRLSYDGQYDAPATLIAKLPATDETAKLMAGGMGAYRKEVMFYRELASETSIRTPKIYQALIDDEGSNFIILMEDLSPAEPGSQLVGESLEHARSALAEAAKLHAAFFDKKELLSKDYIAHTDAEGAAFGQELLMQNWPGFLQRFGCDISEECIAFGNDYVGNHANWITHYSGPKTLTHGDFRSENILFSEAGAAATVDWQTLTESCCMADVAYFIGGSLEIEARRTHEKELVEYYRQCMAEQDVALGADECWQQYRAFSINGLLITVLGAMFSQAEERSDQMFLVMIQRHLQHCVDMNAREFLKG